MAKNVVVVEAIDERKAVREIYKNAHCRRIKDHKGFFVFYTDEYKKRLIIGHDNDTRAGAWRNAFATSIGNKVINTLQS